VKTLVLGGTRFVGKALVSFLLSKGYELTLFNRGTRANPSNVEHCKGDRRTSNGLSALKGRQFDVIVDISGRNLEDTRRVISVTGAPKYRFLYVSSAGVYTSSKFWPIDEDCPLDPHSRHLGKAQTENWLNQQGISFTSFRPTYIYGPGNYNPIERWFFDRIVNNRPVPIPDNGSWITQLGHVMDLAEAMSISLDSDAAENRIYNCSSKRGVTFLGLVEIAALVCGKDMDEVKVRFFDPIGLDPKARKAFPLRIGHFLTDTSLIEKELKWSSKFKLDNGLLDSYKNDYLLLPKNEPDFSLDESLY